jgi:hypothetical protein
MKKFAVLGVDSVAMAHSERAAGTNGNSPDVDCGLVAGLAGDDRDARGPGTGIDLDQGRLNIAPDAVLQGNREGVARMHNRPAGREQQATPLFGARHQRFLALV